MTSNLLVYTVEFDCFLQLSSTVSEVRRFYFATSPGVLTGPRDTPAHEPFVDRIVDPGNFEFHLYAPYTTRGRSKHAFGYLTLNNPDGELDFLREVGWGRRIVIRRGFVDSLGHPIGKYPTDFAIVFDGLVERAEPSWLEVKLILRDRQSEVANRPLNANTYAGSGGTEGGIEVKDRPKPRPIGAPFNGNLVLVSSTKLIWQVADAWDAPVDITLLKDAGVELADRDADYASYADLLDDLLEPDPGHWALYNGPEGTYIRLGSEPELPLTADIEVGSAADLYSGNALHALFTGPGGVAPSDIIVRGNLSSKQIGIWTGSEARTVGEMADLLCAHDGLFWHGTRDGKIVLGRLQLPTTNPVATFTADEIADLGGIINLISSDDKEKGVPSWRNVVRYKPNGASMSESDVAGAVLADKPMLLAPFLEEKADALAVWNPDTGNGKHPNAQILTTETALRLAADALAEAARLRSVYSAESLMIEITVAAELAAGVNLNDTVTVQAPRFDLDDGVNFVVLGIKEDHAEQMISLILLGFPNGLFNP